jgi:hypothetical protein
MNKNLPSHKIGLIFSLCLVAFATGCGSAATSAAPTATLVANLPEMRPPSGDHFTDTVRHSKRWSATPRHRQVEEHPRTPTPSFSARNIGSCGWILKATGDEFPTKEEALEYAKERKLYDRRVKERCTFAPTVYELAAR